MKRSYRQIIQLAAVIASLATLIMVTGCTGSSAAEEPKPLKIAVDTKSFYDFVYRDYIEATFPNLKVELIEMNPDYKGITNEQYVEKLKREKPDLILTWNGLYDQLVKEGLLADLSVRMLDSGMKEGDFYPGMIERMKEPGEGKMYGLAPLFQSSVLYYNTDLFEKYGVEPPHDDMTLEEVYELASRFKTDESGKKGVVGLHQPFSNLPNSMLMNFALSEGIRNVNYTAGKMSMDTPLWKHMIETVVNLYKFGTLTLNETKGKMVDGVTYYDKDATQDADLFKQGKAAMTIAYYGGQYNNGNKFKVGYVGPPVSSTDRKKSSNVYIFDIMAIGANATNPDKAWDVIRWMNSDHIAKVQSKLGTDRGFPTRKSYLSYVQDPVVKHIFDLEPFRFPADPAMTPAAHEFETGLADLVNNEMTAAIKGEKSVDAAIQSIQKDGQTLLDTWKKTQ